MGFNPQNLLDQFYGLKKLKSKAWGSNPQNY